MKIRPHSHQLILITFILLLTGFTYAILPSFFPETQRYVIAIFVFASLFWAFEVIPLYATSLLVVLLLTFFLSDSEGALGLSQSSFTYFLVPFSSPVIMLFLGGFVLSAALRKHRVDEFIVKNVISHVGTNAYLLLLAYLLLSAFFSMWISNTAATALMLMLVRPILLHINEKDPFRKALVLGIAFGASIGGIGTPIGTPPNALVIGFLGEHGVYIDFLEWIVMALPLVLIILSITYLVILFYFRPKSHHIYYHLPTEVCLSRKGIKVIAVACMTIFLWLTTPFHKIPESITALLSVAIFAATELIETKDLNHIHWEILILMWGGLALGQGFESTGLVSWFISLPFFSEYGFMIVLIFSLLAVVLSSFMSNTATANILLPIAVSITSYDRILLSITVAIACSFALAFPISTPPNAMAYSLGVVKTREMFKAGATISLIALIIVLLGFETVIVSTFSKHFI